MTASAPVDGFALHYTDHGAHYDPAVILLHGWPGNSRDYRDVVARLDGMRVVVPDLYLRHFWTHWSGPSYQLEPLEFDALVDGYARPGAFEASINWYRAGAGTMASAATQQPPDPDERTSVPTIVLWPDHDPLFPREWSDHLSEWFTGVELRHADGVGHFTPLEAPDAFAEMVRAAANRTGHREPGCG